MPSPCSCSPPALHAGTFSTAAWTNDATSGIANGQTTWAYHFGSTTAATVDGVTVTGIAAVPVTTNPDFDLAAPTPAVFNNDLNTLTSLTGTGSAVIARDFVYSNQAGGVMSVTVKGLTVGSTYTVTFLSVGWEAAGARLLTFASGADSRSVDQGQFGDNNGIRIDYTFTATAATRLITLTPQNASFRFHLYGLALRPETAPTTVTTTADSGLGSLRWALVNAAERSGADTVTFDPALSGQTILLLASEIAISDTGGVTVDASSLPAGITLSGGATKRLFYLDSGTLATFRAVTLTGGNASGAFGFGRGGAIYSNNATLTLDRCTLHGNTAASATGDGGAIFVNFGTVALTNCTLANNTAGSRGGAIFNKGPLTLTHCTVVGNSASGPGIQEGGGIYNEFVACTLDNSIVATNTAASGFGTQILQDGGTLTSTGANLVAIDNEKDIHGGATVVGTFTNTPPNLAALASNGGPTQTMLPNAGSPAINAAVGSTAATDQRGLSRPQGGTADIGAVETVPASGLLVQNNSDSGPGSLRQAVLNAEFIPGADTITFSAGLSGQTITLTSGHLTLGSDVTIDGSTLPGGITLSGGDGDFVQEAGESGIFYIPYGVTVVLCRLNLINGMTGGGGAIYSLGQLTVDQCTISACRASFGGGIANAGTLNLTQSTLSGNSASIDGGGIYNNGGTVTLTQSTLSGNAARTGGGIYNNGGTLTLTQSTLSGNAASFDGGGISNAGTLNLTQSTLSDNSASEDGGGISNVGALTLIQSTLSDNSASEDGGGIYNSTGTVTLTQSTLSGNAASIYGGGIYHYSGTLTCTQSTLSGNSASLVGGGIFKPVGTLTLNRTLVAGNTADFSANISGSFSGSNNLTSGDPLLAPLGNYGGPTPTRPPLPGSPALDAGGSTTETTDQRGAPRVADGDGNGSALVDIGAVEVTPAIVTSTADSGPGSLRAALADPFTGIVFFAPGLSGQTITLTTGQLTLSRSVAIDASGVTGGITISGNSNGDNVLDPGESRLFDIPAGVTVVLRRLNLINGMAGDGGAIRNFGQLTVDQCTLSACRASFGGGIGNYGTLTLTQSTLSGNSASQGGGIYHSGGGPLTLTQSTLSGNTASINGGGIYGFGTLALNRSIVAGNTANAFANISGSFSGSNNLTSGDPLLAPLGNYGGPTQTMPPLPGSPALDAGGSTTDPTDQRGALRVADGDGNGSATVDIGAVEVTPAIVTSLADSGAGSLRAALAASSTDIVLFDPSLSGQTITLTSGQLTPSRGVGIDATRLAGGLTISGGSNGDNVLEPGESRLFDIPAGVAVSLRGLNLINGIADPAMNNATGEGGAIRNSGQLTLDLCTLSNCRSRRGGAINSTGVLTARRSSFQQNTATFGGAIHSADNGLLTVAQSTFLMNTAHDRGGAVLQNDADSPPGHPTFTRCTFHGNAAARGGAVNSFSLTNLLHCTISANSASGLGGGGVLASATSVVTLTNCVVAGNSNGSSPDLGIEGNGSLTTAGVNLVSNLTGSGLSAGLTLLTGDPLLAPIADYGGPTPTRALLPGSPARNATTFVVDSADQRGFFIVGLRDLGAYEAGTLSNFEAFAIETPGAALSPTGDADNDGRSDLLEYATQNDPHASSTGEITPTTTSQNAVGAVTQANVTFPTRVGATDLIYTLRRSTTLSGDWTPVATWNATTGVLTQASGVSASRHPGTGLVSVTDTNVSGEDRAFYRLDVQQAP